jgi:septum formation protein
MLEAAGLAVEVVPAEVDEDAIRGDLVRSGAPPKAVAEVLARAKAEAVSRLRQQRLVIGADQVLALGDTIFSKAVDAAEARRQLLALRGRSHQLHTAAVLATGGKAVWSAVETATLTMRPFSDAFLEDYLAAAGEGVTRTVGAYEIEGRGVQLFERIDGDTFTIIGLPLLRLLAELRARGVIET